MSAGLGHDKVLVPTVESEGDHGPQIGILSVDLHPGQSFVQFHFAVDGFDSTEVSSAVLQFSVLFCSGSKNISRSYDHKARGPLRGPST